jgi:hypothetical protein
VRGWRNLADLNSRKSTDDFYDADCDPFVDQSPAPGSILCDPEFVEFACMDQSQVGALLDKAVDELLANLPPVSSGIANNGGLNQQQQHSLQPSLAKLLLHLHGWDFDRVTAGFLADPKRFLIEVFPFFRRKTRTGPSLSPLQNHILADRAQLRRSWGNKNAMLECSVCFEPATAPLIHLDCGHGFCRACWRTHVETQLRNGSCGPGPGNAKCDTTFRSI